MKIGRSEKCLRIGLDRISASTLLEKSFISFRATKEIDAKAGTKIKTKSKFCGIVKARVVYFVIKI